MAVSVSLAGYRCTDARVTIPAWGLSYADVTVDGEQTIAAGTQAVLVAADLTVACTVLSGGPAVGRSFYRVVTGAGGWGKTIKKRAYSNDAGVKLVTVLQDAANECGESLDASTVDPSAKLGSYFVRRADLACRVLEQLAPNAWYVGEDGITRLGARPATQTAVDPSVTSQVDLAHQRATVSSDAIAQLLPGLSFRGLDVVDVEHHVSAEGGLRSTLWGRIGAGQSRRLAAWRALFDQLDPNRAYRGTFEYRVTTLSGQRLNLQVVRVSTGLPDVQAVLPRPGSPGAKGSPALGSRVLVTFVNADPTYPVVVAYENPEASGFLPTSVTYDSSGDVNIGPSASSVVINGGTIGVAFEGSQVTSFFPPGLMSGTVAGVGPFTGTVTFANPISGSISGGCSATIMVK